MGRLLIGGKEYDCPLFFGDNEERRCVGCGNVLTGRRRRWCSDACSDRWAINHYWKNARDAALRRDDGACTSCGATWQWPEGAAWRRFLGWLAGSRPWPRDFATREEFDAAVAPWRAADALLAAERKQRAPEVNHKVPILGRHAEAGCHHHQDGLETLCHRCHVAMTNEQRSAGLFARVLTP